MKKLGFGLMRLPLSDPKEQSRVDLEQVCAMADTFLDRGFTYFDTAYVYHKGESERVAKEAIVKRHDRNSFTLATKMPIFNFKSGDGPEKRLFRRTAGEVRRGLLRLLPAPLPGRREL